VRILWLKTEILHPVDKGGKIRTYQMLKHLKREHEIVYLTLDDATASKDDRLQAEEYCTELLCIPHKRREKFTLGFYADIASNLTSPLPYSIEKYRSRVMCNEILKQARTGNFDILVSDFLSAAVNLPRNLSLTSLLFQHNVEAKIWKRHYEIQNNPLKRAYLYDQWRRMFAFERKVCQQFDTVVAVSKDDREQMVQDYGIETIDDVPTGVDTEYFRPRGGRSGTPNLVFTGSMDWLPNEDAIRYFIQQIMPLIKHTIPTVTLTVVGRNPYRSLLELSAKDASLIVTGRVEDVRPYMEQAAVYIIPLRIGGGTRLKIYEAMAMERPIVSTTVGAEGLPVKNGVHLLLADQPASFAEAVVNILSNRPLADALAGRAAALVREQFGWDKATEKFVDICLRTLKRRHPRFQQSEA